jgi:hypothetical protein
MSTNRAPEIITRIADALEKRCVNGEGNCVTTDCMAWEFYIDPLLRQGAKKIDKTNGASPIG